MSSATIIENCKKTFIATDAVGAYLLTKLDASGNVVLATGNSTGEVRVGFTDRAAGAGEATGIVLLNGGGTAYATPGEPVTIGAELYAGDDGKLSLTSHGAIIGYALDAGDTDDVIELMLA
jgi:hypothetical protein